MQRTRKTFILLVMVNLTVTFIAAQSKAETPVIGFIAQDTTWTQANSPYVTLGNVIVKEGVTLTIEPGVTIQFDSGHSLTIEGILIAKGTDNQTIKFTPKENKYPGAWDGIVFEDTNTDAKFDDAGNYISGSILQYCTVEFAGTAVKANSASSFIDHCVITNSANGGISVSKGDIVVIRNSMIVDNKSRGISVVDSESVTLIGNTLTGNIVTGGQPYGGGVYISGGSAATISRNIFTENTVTAGDVKKSAGGGIYVSVGDTVIIENNTLTGNKATGGYSKGGSGNDGGHAYGGGVYVKSDTVTISDNVLVENTAKGGYGYSTGWTSSSTGGGHAYGGGVYVEGNVTVNGNTFTGNTTTGGNGLGKLSGHGYGGGIYIVGDNATVNNNTLTRNTAKGGNSGYYGDSSGDSMGGGIYIVGNNATVNNNALTENEATGGYSEWSAGDGGYAYGGGIYIAGDVTINDNTFTTNIATGGASDDDSGHGGYAYGGGIYIEGNPTIDCNVLIGNIATGGGGYGESVETRRYTRGGNGIGGGIYVKGDPTINSNIFAGNTATGGYSKGGSGGNGSGCIYITGDNATISNNALAGNKAIGGYGKSNYGGGYSAGIYVSVSDTAIINDNTLTGNTAEDLGGGIYASGAIKINDNTITENRISGSKGAAICYSGSQDITGNLIANNVAEETGNTNAVYIYGTPTFTGNAIIGNQTKYNLYYSEGKDSPNLKAINNYWGAATEAEIRVNIYDFFADNSKAFVDVAPFFLKNPLPLGSLTVVVSPKALPADGASTAIVTATLKDSKGNPVVDEHLTMLVSQGTGRLSEVKNNKDGTYTATYTASREVGAEVILVVAPKQRLAKSIEIKLTNIDTQKATLPSIVGTWTLFKSEDKLISSPIEYTFTNTDFLLNGQILGTYSIDNSKVPNRMTITITNGGRSEVIFKLTKDSLIIKSGDENKGFAENFAPETGYSLAELRRK